MSEPDRLRAYTDKELARLLPTWPLGRRIEEVIRKYVGGAMSSAYDGENSAAEADARIARYLMRKIQPWLAVLPQSQEPEPPNLVERAQTLCRAAVEGSATGNIPIQSVYEMMLILIGRGDIVDAMDADWRALEAGGDPPPPEQP